MLVLLAKFDILQYFIFISFFQHFVIFSALVNKFFTKGFMETNFPTTTIESRLFYIHLNNEKYGEYVLIKTFKVNDLIHLI
jgi:hypothetical protein